MYTIKNTLLHGLLVASLSVIPVAGFGVGSSGSDGGTTGGTTSGTTGTGGGKSTMSTTRTNPSTMTPDSYKDTNTHLDTRYLHPPKYSDIDSSRGVPGTRYDSGRYSDTTSGQTGVSTSGLAWIYYGRPHSYAPYYNYYPYRPYHYHYHYYPYRPYYYHYGW